MQKSFLVTGCSSGIGKATACLLAEGGHMVFAGIRTQQAVDDLLKINPKIYPLQLEITSSESIENAKKKIAEITGNNGLDGLVNNAAIAVSAPLEFVPLDELRKQFEVNVIGLIELTQTLLPMLRMKKGRIVNVGSLSGLLTTPFLGSYCASKYAVEAVTDALRMELNSSGIKVSLIEPGSIATPMWKNSLDEAVKLEDKMPAEYSVYRKAVDQFREVAIKTGDKGIPPEYAAKKIEHALFSNKPKTRYLVGKEAKSYALIKKLLPDRLFDFLIYKELKMK